MLNNPEIRNQLIPFLPAGEDLPQDESQLLQTLQSPHFQQVYKLGEITDTVFTIYLWPFICLGNLASTY